MSFPSQNQDMETDGRRNKLGESLQVALSISIFVWFPLLLDRASASAEKSDLKCTSEYQNFKNVNMLLSFIIISASIHYIFRRKCSKLLTVISLILKMSICF